MKKTRKWPDIDAILSTSSIALNEKQVDLIKDTFKSLYQIQKEHGQITETDFDNHNFL